MTLSPRDNRRNMVLFFLDSMLFMPAMALISIQSVIPYFLSELNASTFEIGLAAALAAICTFLTQPLFGSLAMRARLLHKRFSWILLIQRLAFLAFVLCIPLIDHNAPLLIWTFLFFWGLFNAFVGSYMVFYTPLMLKLIPRRNQGTVRGLGAAAGSLLGVGAASLIAWWLRAFAFPYNYMLVLGAGTLLLMLDGLLFMWMREPDDETPRQRVTIAQYVKAMPEALTKTPPFYSVLLTCIFLVIAASMLSYYSLYAIRAFSANSDQIAFLTGLAVAVNAVGYVGFGALLRRWSPRRTLFISAALMTGAGAIVLLNRSLAGLYVAWALANLGNSAYALSFSIIMGEACPRNRMPVFVGVYSTVTLSTSALIMLVLAPIMDKVSFMPMFIIISACGLISALFNWLLLGKHLRTGC